MSTITKLDEYSQLHNVSIVYNRNNQLTGFNGNDYRLFEVIRKS